MIQLAQRVGGRRHFSSKEPRARGHRGRSPCLVRDNKLYTNMNALFLPIKLARSAFGAAVLAVLLPFPSAFAQQASFKSQNLTGSLMPSGTVNLKQLSEAAPANTSAAVAGARDIEVNPKRRPVLRPPVRNSGPYSDVAPLTPRAEAVEAARQVVFRGFNGITHLDTRNARNGNQFSVEPPDQGLAVGNGFVLEAVNEALNVYDVNGIQKLLHPVALSQFFGLPAAIDRTTTPPTHGVAPVDVSATFDPETQRWSVIAWAQLNDKAGLGLTQSRLYLAVSQTSDPTGSYSVYTLDTTDPHDGRGPRVPDYPHFAVDHYGVFISFNEFAIDPATGGLTFFIDAAITAISKKALVTGSGGAPPPVIRFALQYVFGYEFTVFPAYPAPDTGPVLANGGTQYFVSSRSVNTTEHSLAVWALTNTRSLDTTPALTLQAVAVNTVAYHLPSTGAVQKNGFRPLGESLGEPLEALNPDDYRIISVCYSAGRLWATLNTEVSDSAGAKRIGADYFALVPQLQAGILTATVATEGTVSERGANLIYPAIAVNAHQRGGIVFTLVGPNDYPSSAFVPVSGNTVGPIHVSRAGNEPEDGFSGYKFYGGNGIARWGDYSAAAVDADGTIWMATEYSPDLARTTLANWSTYITRYQP